MLKERLRAAGPWLLCALWVGGAIAAAVHHTLPERSGWSNDPAVVAGPGAGGDFVLVLNNWSSQAVFTHVVGQLLERRGQPVEFIESDAVLQFDLLADGDAHFQVEVWHNRMASDLERAMDRGVIDAGAHQLRFRDGWWVSDATLARCPDAGDWAGLSACMRGDTASGAAGVGEFVAPPEAFGRDYRTLISVLGMPVVQTAAADMASLKATWAAFDTPAVESETDAATEPDAVRAVYNWSPNTEGGPINGRFVAFPPPEMACFRDPDWGPNPNVTGDCGDPPFYAVSKAAWSGVLDAFPDIWPVLQAVRFDTTDYRQVVAWMAAPGAVPAEVATRWLEVNADRAERWLGQPLS